MAVLADLTISFVTTNSSSVVPDEEDGFAQSLISAVEAFLKICQGIVLGPGGLIGVEFCLEGRGVAFGGGFKDIELEFTTDTAAEQAIHPLTEDIIGGRIADGAQGGESGLLFARCAPVQI